MSEDHINPTNAGATSPTGTMVNSPDEKHNWAAKASPPEEKEKLDQQQQEYREKKETGESGEEAELKRLNAKLANPLRGLSKAELLAQVDAFAAEADMGFFLDDLRKGALVAQNPLKIDEIEELSEEEREVLWRERSHKWDQTKTLYWLIFMCSMGAAVQGMDETVINGAQLFYPAQFGIGFSGQTDELLVGLVNGAPYLASAVLGCWLTYPLNKFFGRRGSIFISSFFAFGTCIWSGVTNSWPHLFVARFFLGIGIGPKSASIPVFAAECAPAPIRGALVMQWQTWTAFGIMLGTVSSLIFKGIPQHSHGITGLAWRLMLGSACLPAVIVCAQVFFVPESPRWLLGRKNYHKAYRSLLRLRKHKIQVARDLFYTAKLLEEEAKVEGRHTRALELFTIPRNARATLAAGVVMFGQQFCGVNAIAYYSSNIFKNSGFNTTSSLLGSFGFGILNWLFALPAFFTIDTFGRRNLLLVTYPFLALFMLVAGLGFLIPETNLSARVGVVSLGMYMFTVFYSPGMGPVPFSYSAECFPLYIREVGMAYATAITWLFNFVIAFTFPLLVGSFTSTGAFGWYAAWNVILFFLSLLFVPETKQLTLEELDQVFSVPTWKHARYHITTPIYAIRRHILRQRIERPPLYEYEGDMVGGDGKAEDALLS